MAEIETLFGDAIRKHDTGTQGHKRQHLFALLDNAERAARLRGGVEEVLREPAVERQLGE